MYMLVIKFSRSKPSTPPLYYLRILSTKDLCNNVKYVTCMQEFLPSNEKSSDLWQGRIINPREFFEISRLLPNVLHLSWPEYDTLVSCHP